MRGIEERQDDEEEDFEENHPFTPALTNNSRRINEMKNIPPIHLRYQNELNKKEQNIQKLKEQERRRHQLKLSSKRRNRSKDDFHRSEPKDFYQSDMDWLEKKNRKL